MESEEHLQDAKDNVDTVPEVQDDRGSSDKDELDLADLPTRGRAKPIYKSPEEFWETVKVHKYIETGTPHALQVVRAPGRSLQEFLVGYNVAKIKQMLKAEIPFKFIICLNDGSVVPETMSMKLYFQSLEPLPPKKEAQPPATGEKKPTEPASKLADGGTNKEKKAGDSAEKEQTKPADPKAHNTKARELTRDGTSRVDFAPIGIVYVKELPATLSPTDIFKNLPFTLRFVQKTNGKNKYEASISSSAQSQKHEFCLQDETPFEDRTLLSTYLSHSTLSDKKDGKIPIYDIYFSSPTQRSEWSAASDVVKPQKIDTKVDLSTGFTKLSSLETIQGKAGDLKNQGLAANELNDLVKITATSANTLHASELDENQWHSVLRNCGLMHGWTVDLERNIVKPAPRAAFKLRAGLNMDSPISLPHLTTGSTTTPVAPKAPAAVLPPTSTPGNTKAASAAIKTGSTTKPTEEQPSAAPNKEVAKASTKKELTQDASLLPLAIPVEASPQVVPAKVMTSDLPKKANALPSFVVNDESKITVSLVSHELQESMARNSFSSTSFEGEVSGGFKGVSVGVTAGTKSSTTKGEAKSETIYEKKLIAEFKFPRATIFLRPEDLEPTDALRSAVDKVRRTKNINDLRALQAEFGHIFCQEVIVGGSLQTTRVTNSKSTVSESRQKEEFKAHFGLAVSTPWGIGGSSKASKQTGSEDEEAIKETNVNDMSAFEAKGGQTIYAANPPTWCASVLPFNNWRVIERSEPLLLATAISSCSDVKMVDVKQWFLSAVPQLSQYLAIPPSRCLDVRLKVQSDIPGLTQEIGDKETPIEKQHHICNYLGHQFGKAIHPIRMGLKRRQLKVTEIKRSGGTSFGMPVTDITRDFKQLDVQKQLALFSPARFQAPVLLQYEERLKKIEHLSVTDYQETAWQMIIPDGQHLKHDSLVALRSYHEKMNIYLTVFRNEQGVVLPAMTDSGEFPLWRVQTVGGSSAQYIKEGDPIRLCWRFSDQTCGFRDFFNDVYGRRRFTKPEEIHDSLYLRTPFPGFQRADSIVPVQVQVKDPVNTGVIPNGIPDMVTPAPSPGNTPGSTTEQNGAAMVMSPSSSVKPILTKLSVIADKGDYLKDSLTYNLFDVTFRIDMIGNRPSVEKMDYMTQNLDQRTSTIVTTETGSRSMTWSIGEGQQAADNYAEAGKQVLGVLVFGAHYHYLRAEYQPLSRILASW
ncbi:hypothetical protein LT330_000069 [Penicillium expansum]|nr:hypothetical protein LT330_000069 [Penicillium expansum]